MKVISYGGGVQSTAMIVLAVQGRIPDVDAALFANVGDDSEHPDTIDYVRRVIAPYAADHDLPLHELRRTFRDGTPAPTLYQKLTKPGSRSIGIPVRMSNGAPASRSCTADYKIRVVDKWLRQHGASRANPASVLIGISTDEILRLNNRRPGTVSVPAYPLIDLGLSRDKCMTVIRDAGLPVPGKSSCYFCPFHRPTAWQELAETRPDLFDKAADLEATINDRRAALGKDQVWLTDRLGPLRDVINRDQLPLIPLGHDGCDSGYCFT